MENEPERQSGARSWRTWPARSWSMFFTKINGKPLQRCSGVEGEWEKTQDHCHPTDITLAGRRGQRRGRVAVRARDDGLFNQDGAGHGKKWTTSMFMEEAEQTGPSNGVGWGVCFQDSPRLLACKTGRRGRSFPGKGEPKKTRFGSRLQVLF